MNNLYQVPFHIQFLFRNSACTQSYTLAAPVDTIPEKITVSSTNYPGYYPDEEIDCTYYFTAASGNKINFDFAGNTVTLDPSAASLRASPSHHTIRY